MEAIRDEQLHMTEQFLSQAIKTAKASNISLKQLNEMLRILYKEKSLQEEQ